MQQQQTKPWYKKWWVWLIAVIILLIAIGGASNNETSTQESSNSSQKAAKPKQWTKVSELTGDTQEKSGEVFTASGGNLRIKYTVNTTSDTGTALLYLLPEGSTITKNSKGEMDIAVQEISTFGNKTGERIIQKPQGNYYLFINTSAVKDYSISVEEQK